MTKIFKIIKDYSTVQERNLFIENKVIGLSQIKAIVLAAVSNANVKVCAVLELGITDLLMQILLSNAIARKYIVVPQIKEDKYKQIAGKAIIREVPTVKGNYLIVDENQLFMFDSQLNGMSVADTKAVSVVQQIFMHEFWGAEAKFEYIDKKELSAEKTFDIPPVYGNDVVLIDFSQSDNTKVDELLAMGNTAIGFTDKVHEMQISSSIVLKNIALNKTFLERTNNNEIVYAPSLPLSFIQRGKEFFVCNFDIEQYLSRKIQERHTGRLFAVKCPNGIAFGQTYNFVKHKARAELVGVNALDITGNAVEIMKTAAEERSIIADVSMAKEYAKMSAEALEARLQTRQAGLLDSDKKVCSVTFNITVELLKRKMKNKASIYGKYESLNKEISTKARDISINAEAAKLPDLQAEILFNAEIMGNLSTIIALQSAVAKINGWVEKYATLVAKNSKVDDSLAEVKGGKKKKPAIPTTLSKLTVALPTMDLPKFGTLYQDGSKYEYTVQKEEDFDAARAEMTAAKISDITYHLE